MNTTKYIIGTILLTVLLFTSCQEEDQEFGELISPTNIDISVTYLDDIDQDGEADITEAPGLGSGEVRITASANDAISYHVIVQGQTKVQESGSVSHIFAILGENTYPVTVIAFGPGGTSSVKTIEIDVLSLYEPPADLLELLYGDGSRVWRIRNEVANHFGLGPAAGNEPFSFFGAGANEKEGVGMYDDRYIFNQDGTFTHITDSTNDNPVEDTSGTVFGREILINELGGVGGGDADGADIINYGYEDYSESMLLSAPGGVETINLGGIGFIGYYVGGNHQYQIINREANSMTGIVEQITLKTTDGNGQFDWGFVLTYIDE
jgi:hypothetical protein